MRVPNSLLPKRVFIDTYQGDDGKGRPVYDGTKIVRCRLEGKRVRAVTKDGSTVTGVATAMVPPTAVVAAEDRLRDATKEYRVLEVQEGLGLRTAAFRLLVLGGPR